ncbi:MAG: PhzF family phenazine biosynthesis protein, partial [Oscillospiraceae bacterium]|nr:PhzF family phenazine biosynthesis protein [Oscillospiraceae bacterium]
MSLLILYNLSRRLVIVISRRLFVQYSNFWPSEEFMLKLAIENNLSETAFIVKEEQGYHLRWFTPGSEVDLCGNATLASSFVIFNYFDKDSDTIEFNTLSGKLTVSKKDGLYVMDFPMYEQKSVPVTND